MHFACRIPKTRVTDSWYLIPIAFPLQYWFREGTLVLRHTYFVLYWTVQNLRVSLNFPCGRFPNIRRIIVCHSLWNSTFWSVHRRQSFRTRCLFKEKMSRKRKSVTLWQIGLCKSGLSSAVWFTLFAFLFSDTMSVSTKLYNTELPIQLATAESLLTSWYTELF